MDDTSALVERARTGNADALSQLVRRFQDAAFAYALAMVRDFHLAQDVTQESLLVMSRNLDKLGDPAAFPGWFHGIVRNRGHRALRRARLATLPLDDAFSVPARPQVGGDPAANLAHEEERRRLLGALATLPRGPREVLTLFYIRDYTQAQIAAFLGVPVTTVNNRLHAARQLLKGKVLVMVQETMPQQSLPDDFPQKVGRIARVDGPVIEAAFPPRDMPDILSVVGIEGGGIAGRARVVQRRPDGSVRCVATTPIGDWRPGMRITTVAEHVAGLDDAALEEAVHRLAPSPGSAPARAPAPAPGRDSPAVLETGIKVIDVMCPLRTGGTVGIFSMQGVGRIVLVQELLHRLGQGRGKIAVFCPTDPRDVTAVQDMLTIEEAYPGDAVGEVEVIWPVTRRATDRAYAGATELFDAVVFVSPVTAAEGLWPAVDALVSHSRMLTPEVVGPEHCAVAAGARELLAREAELMRDPVLLEHLAYGAYHLARDRAREFTPQRLAELGAADRQTVARARRLRRYFTNPFFVAEAFTGMSGQHVPRSQAVRDCADILAGRFDEAAEESLLFIGAMKR